LDPLVGQLYRGLGGEGPGFALVRLVLLFFLLLPPAAFMGATLPVLVGHFEAKRLGPALARLYALNTFGAVSGSMVGGFALMSGVGLIKTTWVAAGLNAAVALIAWVASGREPEAIQSPRPRSATGAKRGAADESVSEEQPGALRSHSQIAFALLFAF